LSATAQRQDQRSSLRPMARHGKAAPGGEKDELRLRRDGEAEHTKEAENRCFAHAYAYESQSVPEIAFGALCRRRQAVQYRVVWITSAVARRPRRRRELPRSTRTRPRW